MTTNTLWEDHKKLVYAWVHTSKKKCPAADLDDLIGEGQLAFVLTVDTWDPEKGMFSTHLTWQLKARLSSWIRHQTRHNHPEIPDGATSVKPFLSTFFECIGAEAQTLVHHVLEGGCVRTLGGPRRRQLVFQEVKTALRTC